jgi:hypothetical protein
MDDITIDQLPAELFFIIFENSSSWVRVWKLRAVSKRWANMVQDYFLDEIPESLIQHHFNNVVETDDMILNDEAILALRKYVFWFLIHMYHSYAELIAPANKTTVNNLHLRIAFTNWFMKRSDTLNYFGL